MSDLYAFVSPDDPDTVTIIANYAPVRVPAGGPDFSEFGDDVLYEIHIDANGDARPDLTYQFRFRTELRDDRTLLYHTGPIESLDSGNWNRRQFYSVTKVDAHGKSTVLARELPCPPCNVGPLSVPGYDRLAADAVVPLATGEKVFAGQRADAVFADPGALCPFLGADPAGRSWAGEAVDATGRRNVHSIAVQVPLHQVRRDGGRKVRGRDPGAVIGVWTSASRRQVQVCGGGGKDGDVVVGPHVQVSRLGNPLVSDLIVPAAERARWNALPPAEDKRFAQFVERPELAGLLPVLHPGRFDNLARLTEAGTARADLVAILLTGIPEGLIDDFQNCTGDTQADMLRLNTAVPPAREPDSLGLLGGDLAGFPNGRRITDDVVSISLRAIAGATMPLVDETFRPDDAAVAAPPGPGIKDVRPALLTEFPYLGTPYDAAVSDDPQRGAAAA